MPEKLRLVVVDDDPNLLTLVGSALSHVGHDVTLVGDPTTALATCEKVRPDCIIVDLMMPGLDGLQICRAVRSHPELADVPIIVASGKSYASDRDAALASGASAFLPKPFRIEELFATVSRLVVRKIELTFWGVRGTLPVPGPGSVRYGGNTNCLTLRFPNGAFFVLDAGTGIRNLGNSLVGPNGPGELEGHVFITHAHWDHINALPFFAPLYVQRNHWTICGPRHGSRSMRDMVQAQMDGTFFPITPREFAAQVDYLDLSEETREIAGVEVASMLLMHPGTTLGYRFRFEGRTVCYVTDNELYPEGMPQRRADYVERLVEFARGADCLVIDATYFDEEYPQRVGWGHSSVGEVTRFAAETGVQRLFLHHHDPGQTDDDIDQKVAVAHERLHRLGVSLTCTAAREGDRVEI